LLDRFVVTRRQRIRDILLVSSQYDSYIFEEDGRLYEQIRNEYQDLSLSHTPELTRVSSGRDALRLARDERRFDLIITTMHIEDMHPLEFAREARSGGIAIPIVLLAFENNSWWRRRIGQSFQRSVGSPHLLPSPRQLHQQQA
jgi:CheY-like chemotaxis protein